MMQPWRLLLVQLASLINYGNMEMMPDVAGSTQEDFLKLDINKDAKLEKANYLDGHKINNKPMMLHIDKYNERNDKEAAAYEEDQLPSETQLLLRHHGPFFIPNLPQTKTFHPPAQPIFKKKLTYLKSQQPSDNPSVPKLRPVPVTTNLELKLKQKPNNSELKPVSLNNFELKPIPMPNDSELKPVPLLNNSELKPIPMPNNSEFKVIQMANNHKQKPLPNISELKPVTLPNNSEQKIVPVPKTPVSKTPELSKPNHQNITRVIHNDKTSKDHETNIFLRHLIRQRSNFHHKLIPTAVLSTTPIPESTLAPNATKGILINPRGKPSKMFIHSATPQNPSGRLKNRVQTTVATETESNSENKRNNKTNHGKGKRLSSSLLKNLNPRRKRNNFHQKINRKSSPVIGFGDIQPNWEKRIPNIKAKIVSSSGVQHPLGDRNASESIPVVIVTTQTPIIRTVTHKKLVESKTYRRPKYMYRNRDLYHEPLHSKYGPPYDHYKFSNHRSLGGSFPPPVLPQYNSNNKFLQEHMTHTEMPHLIPSFAKMKSKNHAKPTSYYMDKKPRFLAPTLPSVTVRPIKTPPSYNQLTPIRKMSEMNPLKPADPYFQPHNHPKAGKKKFSTSKATGKAINFESTSAQGKDYIARYSAVSAGIPGVDYPIYSRIPYTAFTCKDKRPPGIYGDTEAGCQVWHICEADGRQHSFLCPNGTIFNQQLLTCDWWYNVQCSDTENYHNKLSAKVYELNNNHITVSEKFIHKKTIPLHKFRERSDWSSYSNFNTTTHMRNMEAFSPPKPVRFFRPSPGKEIPVFSPRGSKSIIPMVPTRPPKFIEFQPYHKDTYPMFQLKKRHVKI